MEPGAVLPFLFNMKIRLQNSLALIGATVLHAALLLLPVPELELGKNTPTLVYPVRVRVVARQLSQASPPNAPQAVPPVQIATVALPPASVAEGSTDSSEKIYTDIREVYFRPAELDVRPVVVTHLDLGASNISPTKEGEAIVRFFINESGSVDRMEIEESTLPEAMVDQLYVQRELLYFTPGRKYGLDVKSVIVYKIHLAREPVTLITGSGAR